MSWEKITEHVGASLHLLATEGVDKEKRPVTQLQWVGRGDRVLVETRRKPDAAYFTSQTGVVIGVTYPGEKGHGLLPGRTLHIAESPTKRGQVAMSEITRLVNLDFVLGQARD
ncbi:hypothetical protein K2P56_04780 [Patescibacteria group bacterium]|nr:hypothetical protein [Patescibacteria group bacterium]